MADYIGGEVATRIMHEVMRGVFESKDDTPDEADYRRRLKDEVEEIKEKGGIVDMPKDWQ